MGEAIRASEPCGRSINVALELSSISRHCVLFFVLWQVWQPYSYSYGRFTETHFPASVKSNLGGGLGRLPWSSPWRYQKGVSLLYLDHILQELLEESYEEACSCDTTYELSCSVRSFIQQQSLTKRCWVLRTATVIRVHRTKRSGVLVRVVLGGLL